MHLLLASVRNGSVAAGDFLRSNDRSQPERSLQPRFNFFRHLAAAETIANDGRKKTADCLNNSAEVFLKPTQLGSEGPQNDTEKASY